jgi:hypothetical protein
VIEPTDPRPVLESTGYRRTATAQRTAVLPEPRKCGAGANRLAISC